MKWGVKACKNLAYLVVYRIDFIIGKIARFSAPGLKTFQGQILPVFCDSDSQSLSHFF